MHILEPRILVLIPAYNEQDNIESVIKLLRYHTPNLDILVVNDCSTDQTDKKLKQLNVPHITHTINLNYGGALQTGFKYAVKHEYDYVIQFDGDGQHLASEIPKLLALMTENDIVIGSRYLNANEYKQTFARKVGTKIFSFVVRAITGEKLTDPTSGFQLLNKKVFSRYAQNFPQDFPDANLLVMMHLAGYKIKEVPVKMQQRLLGESMHGGIKSLKYSVKMFYSIFIAILKAKDQQKQGRDITYEY